jgi:hypothetical protein
MTLFLLCNYSVPFAQRPERRCSAVLVAGQGGRRVGIRADKVVASMPKKGGGIHAQERWQEPFF